MYENIDKGIFPIDSWIINKDSIILKVIKNLSFRLSYREKYMDKKINKKFRLMTQDECIRHGIDMIIDSSQRHRKNFNNKIWQKDKDMKKVLK